MKEHAQNKSQTKRLNHHDIFFKEGYSDPRFAKELFRMASFLVLNQIGLNLVNKS